MRPRLSRFRPSWRARKPQRAAATAAGLVTAVGFLALVPASAGGPGRTDTSDAVMNARSPHLVSPSPAPLGLKRRRRRELRAIDATLSYTPFVVAGTRRRREVALTFDDGPSPYTRAIVSILVRMRAQATFFVVGQQLDGFSAALRDELHHGFDIGDHTQNHAWLARLSPAAQYSQIHDGAARVTQRGAAFPRLFRPPYGAYNAATMATLHRLRMLMVLWSIDPQDWRRPGAAAIVSNVLANARAGAIVLMHDGGGDRSQTVAALPAIINGMRRRHFLLVSVPQLLIDDPPPRHQRLGHISGV